MVTLVRAEKYRESMRAALIIGCSIIRGKASDTESVGSSGSMTTAKCDAVVEAMVAPTIVSISKCSGRFSFTVKTINKNMP